LLVDDDDAARNSDDLIRGAGDVDGNAGDRKIAKDELPVPALPAIREACAITESAVMPMPATVMFKFVREAVE